jgi:hypothetical protein
MKMRVWVSQLLGNKMMVEKDYGERKWVSFIKVSKKGLKNVGGDKEHFPHLGIILFAIE